MGSIVFWGIIRTAIFIPAIAILSEYMDPRYWWSLLLISLYAVIIQPAIIQHRLFMEENKEIFEKTLCSSCNFFDKSAVICLKLDQHPSMESLPCEGLEWEPKNEFDEKEKIDTE